MNRIQIIKQYTRTILNAIEDDAWRNAASIHTYGVAECCALLASRRGLNKELAYISGLLHDLYAHRTGHRSLHSHNGAEMMRVVFKRQFPDLFSTEEQTLILSAIYHHSSKKLRHDPFDEVLKDADVLQRSLAQEPVPDGPRLLDIQKELQIEPDAMEQPTLRPDPTGGTFTRNVFRQVAQELAQRPVSGTPDSSDYMDIIRYFPEDTALDELDHAWCAAFVYHCALQAGIKLPIRYAHAEYRFACVLGWLQWAKAQGLYLPASQQPAPQAGDIVIYHQIIPPENKPATSAPQDHVGIIVDVDGDNFTVTEGNAGNLNVSKLISRTMDQRIDGLIRIPDGWEYDGWKLDYKTGTERVEKY